MNSFICILLFIAGFDKTNPEHKSLLLCLFMTSADLADQTKPWSAAKGVSVSLRFHNYFSFFSLPSCDFLRLLEAILEMQIITLYWKKKHIRHSSFI